MEDILYTVPQVAKILKINANHAYTLINTGKLPALKLGSLKVRKKSLELFLEKYDGKDLSDLNNVKSLISEKEENNGREIFWRSTKGNARDIK